MTVLMPACGWGATGAVLAPVSAEPGSVVKTITIASYQAGKVKMLRGAMGNAVITFVSGQPTFIEWTFTGLWVPPVDASILTPTKPDVKPIRFAGAGLTLGGSSGFRPQLATMTLDLGGDVQLYEDAHIVGRRINGTIDPKASLVTTEDTYGKWLAYNERALAMDIGATGNRLIFTAPKFQMTNVQEADRNGVEVDTITYELNRSGSTTDNDLTIESD